MEDMDLYIEAEKAMRYSYSPYSGYSVGAALLTKSGKVYTGCNIENASYSATVCAERTAVFKAVSDGERSFAKIAIAGSSSRPAWPCGVCRQVMSEFASDDFYVITKSEDELMTSLLSELLPNGFSSESMNK